MHDKRRCITTTQSSSRGGIAGFLGHQSLQALTLRILQSRFVGNNRVTHVVGPGIRGAIRHSSTPTPHRRHCHTRTTHHQALRVPTITPAVSRARQGQARQGSEARGGAIEQGTSHFGTEASGQGEAAYPHATGSRRSLTPRFSRGASPLHGFAWNWPGGRGRAERLIDRGIQCTRPRSRPSSSLSELSRQNRDVGGLPPVPSLV